MDSELRSTNGLIVTRKARETGLDNTYDLFEFRGQNFDE